MLVINAVKKNGAESDKCTQEAQRQEQIMTWKGANCAWHTSEGIALQYSFAIAKTLTIQYHFLLHQSFLFWMSFPIMVICAKVWFLLVTLRYVWHYGANTTWQTALQQHTKNWKGQNCRQTTSAAVYAKVSLVERAETTLKWDQCIPPTTEQPAWQVSEKTDNYLVETDWLNIDCQRLFL